MNAVDLTNSVKIIFVLQFYFLYLPFAGKISTKIYYSRLGIPDNKFFLFTLFQYFLKVTPQNVAVNL